MPVGTSGVAGSSSQPSGVFGAADRVLDLVRNAALYQERMEALEKATKTADDAKREARRILSNATKKAEDDAKAILQAAEEQAQDRLDAVQDLETKLTADKSAWETERTEDQKKTRSDRGKATAAMNAAKKAKEESEAEKLKAQAAREDAEATKEALNAAIKETKAIWQKVGV